jgi:hypothetical protein
MKRCVAYVPSFAAPELWMPCAMVAAESDRFCTQHRDALDGAVLGLRVAEAIRARTNKRVKKQKERNAGANAVVNSKRPAAHVNKP